MSISGLLGCPATPDFVWDTSPFHGWPEKQLQAGAQGVDQVLSNRGGTWHQWMLDLEGMDDVGEQVVALMPQRGHSLLSDRGLRRR